MHRYNQIIACRTVSETSICNNPLAIGWLIGVTRSLYLGKAGYLKLSCEIACLSNSEETKYIDGIRVIDTGC